MYSGLDKITKYFYQAPYCRRKLTNKYVSACGNVTSGLYLEVVQPDDQQGALFDRRRNFCFKKTQIIELIKHFKSSQNKQMNK